MLFLFFNLEKKLNPKSVDLNYSDMYLLIFSSKTIVVINHFHIGFMSTTTVIFGLLTLRRDHTQPSTLSNILDSVSEGDCGFTANQNLKK